MGRQMVAEQLLAVETADLGASTAGIDRLLDDRDRRKEAVHGKDVALLGRARVAAAHARRIGHRGRELLADRRLVVAQEEAARGVRLGHLAASIEGQHFGCDRQDGLRLRESLAKAGVEPPRDHARQLEVLELIGAHGDGAGLVEQDIGSLQHGVVEQPDVGVLGLLAGLVLELRHA
jgi:hypothetical protein